MNARHLLAVMALSMTLTAPGVSAKQNQNWQFDVFLDDERIGHHHFEKTTAGAITTVQIRARFEVKFWFIKAYSYQHTNIEQWADGCLRRINAVTDDNGEKHIVSGRRDDEQFLLQTTDQQSRFEGCVRSFAYWDRERLNAQRLLNAQTGEYVDVQLSALGSERIQLGDTTIDAQRYRLSGEQLSIDLWYAPDSDWLALETTTEGGRRLRYLKQMD